MESPQGMIGKMEQCPDCGRKMKVLSDEEREQRELQQLSLNIPEFAIAGVTKNNVDGWTAVSRQQLLSECSEGDNVTIVWEKNNPYDKNALAILRADGQQLGYVPKEHNRLILKYLLKYQYEATIIWIGGEPSLGARAEIRLVKALPDDAYKALNE